jgi:hypothetical protein
MLLGMARYLSDLKITAPYWTCGMNMLDMQKGHAGLHFKDMCRHAALTFSLACGKDMNLGHAARTCSKEVQHQRAARTYSTA